MADPGSHLKHIFCDLGLLPATLASGTFLDCTANHEPRELCVWDAHPWVISSCCQMVFLSCETISCSLVSFYQSKDFLAQSGRNYVKWGQSRNHFCFVHIPTRCYISNRLLSWWQGWTNKSWLFFSRCPEMVFRVVKNFQGPEFSFEIPKPEHSRNRLGHARAK